MRHYFKTAVDGTVTGVATTDGGFTDEFDLTDDLNQHPYVRSFRTLAQGEESFDRFYQWDCACPAEAVACHCAHLRFHDYYVENNALVEKVPLTVEVQGVDRPEAVDATPLDFAPGTSVTLKLKAAVPDGTTVTVVPGGKTSIIQAATELTFAGGETGAVTLKAPAQGTTGRVAGIARAVRQFSVALRGWA